MQRPVHLIWMGKNRCGRLEIWVDRCWTGINMKEQHNVFLNISHLCQLCSMYHSIYQCVQCVTGYIRCVQCVTGYISCVQCATGYIRRGVVDWQSPPGECFRRQDSQDLGRLQRKYHTVLFSYSFYWSFNGSLLILQQIKVLLSWDVILAMLPI